MANRKDNLKALFSNTRTRVIIIFTAALLLIAVIVGFYKLSYTTPTASDPVADVGRVPTGIQSVPGTTNPNPEYAKLLELQNLKQAEEAKANNTSAIPTIIRTHSIEPGTGVIGPQENTSNFVSLARQDDIGSEQKLWVETLQQANCSKTSMESVLSKGGSIFDLKAGCSCIQLKDNGYKLSDLEPVCPCKDLKAAGYNAIQLKAAGYTAERLHACGFDACESRNAGFSAQEMKDGGFSDGELKGAGFSDEEILRTAGLPDNVSITQVQDAKCNSTELAKLRQAGVSASAIKRMSGCSLEALKAAGYTAEELKNAGYTAAELKKAGFGLKDLKATGYSARDLLNAGYSAADLAGAGFSAAQIQAAEAELPPNISREEVKNSGCDVDTLTKERIAGVSAKVIKEQAGCPSQALKAAGFTDADLANAGFTGEQIAKALTISDDAIRQAGCDPEKLKNLLRAGASASRIKTISNCTAQDLKRAGFPITALEQAGYTPEQLRLADFSQTQVEQAGINPINTIANGRTADCSPEALKRAKAAGVSALNIRKTLGCPFKALQAASFTAKELHDAGASAAELKNLGYSLQNLKNVGFSPKALKDAGFSAPELKALGYNAKTLKDAGFDAAVLKDAGFTPTELKAAGFTAKQLKEANFTPEELKAAGFTAKELQDAGFTDSQLKNAGFEMPGSSIQTMQQPNINQQFSSVPNLANPGQDVITANRANSEQLQKLLDDQTKRAAEQKYQQNIADRTAQMLTIATSSLQSWAQVDVQIYEQGEADKEAVVEGSQIPSVMGTEVNSQAMQNTAPAIVKAGDILYAVIDTSVNSDEPGPILATIVAGRFKGSKLIGSFNLPANASKMVINFNTLSVPGNAGTTSINALAIDPNTARTALSSRTDHHYLMRYGSLFASSFIEGLGNAIQSANTTITIGGTGGLTNTQVENSRSGSITLENAVIALSTVGKNWGQQAQQNMSRPTTVEVFSGTAIGVLFTQDLMTL